MTQHWICSRRTLSLNVTSSDLTTEELLHLAEDMLREDREYLESFNAAVHYRAAARN